MVPLASGAWCDSLISASLWVILFILFSWTITYMFDFCFAYWSFFRLIIFFDCLCPLNSRSASSVCFPQILLYSSLLQRQISLFHLIFCFFPSLCISTFSISMVFISKSRNAYLKMTKMFLKYVSGFCTNSLFHIWLTSEALSYHFK